jgi:hypothetical protein
MVLLTTSGAHSGRGPCREAASSWAPAGAPGPIGLVAGGGLPRLRYPRLPRERGPQRRRRRNKATHAAEAR